MVTLHEVRIAAARTSLRAASEAFVSYLAELPDEVATRALPGGWTPAGHGSHLALTNDVFRSVLNHGPSCPSPLPPFQGTSDFTDEAWNFDAPPKVPAPSILIPPAGVSRAQAIGQLRDAVRQLDATMALVRPATGALVVQLPWAVVSLYQMCEWAGGHTMRHLSQVNRELQLAAVGAATLSRA